MRQKRILMHLPLATLVGLVAFLCIQCRVRELEFGIDLKRSAMETNLSQWLPLTGANQEGSR